MRLARTFLPLVILAASWPAVAVDARAAQAQERTSTHGREATSQATPSVGAAPLPAAPAVSRQPEGATSLTQRIVARLGYQLDTLSALALLLVLITYITKTWWKVWFEDWLKVLGAGQKERRAARNAAREAEQDPQKMHLWNLIGENRSGAERIAMLLEAVNRGAFECGKAYPDGTPAPVLSRPRVRFGGLRRVRACPEKAASLWAREAEPLSVAQYHFIAPNGTTGDGKEGNALEVVKEWIAECDGTQHRTVGRISVRSATGGGTRIFMYRLLLDLSNDIRGSGKSTSTELAPPIPMFVSGESLLRKATALQGNPDPLGAFFEVWLTQLRINIPEKSLKPMIADFKRALDKGQIILLLDGDDRLHGALHDFAVNLLQDVPYWVVAHPYPGPEFEVTDRRITLDPWSKESVLAHMERRWAATGAIGKDNLALSERRQLAKTIIREAFARYEAAVERARDARRTRPQPLWFCQPRNLDLLLDNIDSGTIKDESNIRRATASQPTLFDKIVEGAVSKIGATSDLESIRERLCEIASGDAADGTHGSNARTVKVDVELRRLTDLLSCTGAHGPLSFRHSEMREYFVAGRIARELLDSKHAPIPGEQLARNETWTKATCEAIECWLKILAEHAGIAPSGPLLVAEFIPLVVDRLTRGSLHDTRLPPRMRRNLIEMLIRFERASAKERADPVSLANLDLAGMAGDQLDLHRMKIQSCVFIGASLVDAEFTHATFTDCDFTDANLSGADAVGAAFNDCKFLGKRGVVKGMAIDRAIFTRKKDPDDVLPRKLLDGHASAERSRYRGEFGRKFFEAQEVFLGPGMGRLESDHYLRAIRDAVCAWVRKAPASPVYLVDLMAGGSYKRLAKLREQFKQLHILGIDRDPSQQLQSRTFEWTKREITSDSSHQGVDLDIGELLAGAFGNRATSAHVIVAKKAFHELNRDLQQPLIAECSRALRPGGSLIIFEDTPGLTDGETDTESMRKVWSQLADLRQLLGAIATPGLDTADCDAGVVTTALDKLQFDASAAGQIGFANTWIMVKDWANLNRHEVCNRYFASVPEIRQWASEVFGPPRELQFDSYRLNPRIFNELGIQRALDYLMRETREGNDPTQVVDRNREYLSERIWVSERIDVLVDFTRRQLKPGTPLALALEAEEQPIDLKSIDPAFAILNSADITAPTFNLRCTVLVFQKSELKQHRTSGSVKGPRARASKVSPAR
jgi:SAM-dependent methyltransferase